MHEAQDLEEEVEEDEEEDEEAKDASTTFSSMRSFPPILARPLTEWQPRQKLKGFFSADHLEEVFAN